MDPGVHATDTTGAVTHERPDCVVARTLADTPRGGGSAFRQRPEDDADGWRGVEEGDWILMDGTHLRATAVVFAAETGGGAGGGRRAGGPRLKLRLGAGRRSSMCGWATDTAGRGLLTSMAIVRCARCSWAQGRGASL